MDIRELEENSTPLDVDQPTPDQVEEPKVVERSRDRRKTKTTDDPLKRSKQLEQLKLARQRKKELNEQKKQKRLEVEARITKEIEKEEEFIEKKDEERAPITPPPFAVVEKTKPKPKARRVPRVVEEMEDDPLELVQEDEDLAEDPYIIELNQPTYPSRIPMPRVQPLPPQRRPAPRARPRQRQQQPRPYYSPYQEPLPPPPQYAPHYNPYEQPYDTIEIPPQRESYEARQAHLDSLQRSIFGD
jgi:hypothetical protein